jgi:hypothetical protein
LQLDHCRLQHEIGGQALAERGEREPQPLDAERMSVEFEAGPHEIVTLLLIPA